MLQNEPLIQAELSCASIDWNSIISKKKKALFFGVGLCTSKQPATAIPFDILQFFFIAELLKRQLELSNVFILIADSHALTNDFMDEATVSLLSTKMEQLFHSIVTNFSLSTFEIIKSTDIIQTESFKIILESLPDLDNTYLKNEIADILWLIKHKNVAIKLGWAIDNAKTPGGHDERFFDNKIQELIQAQSPALSSDTISFMHTKPGRTFDRHRQKVSPYISTHGENRLLLHPDENIPLKFKRATKEWGDTHWQGTRKHLANITRLFEKLFGHQKSKSLEQKIQTIQDIAFGKEHI